MGVYISNDELQQFYDNGITHDDIENTVNRYRSEGLSDEQIRAKVDTKLKSFNNKPFFPKTIDEINNLTRQNATEQIKKRNQFESQHPFMARLNKDFNPSYRGQLAKWENEAKYGINSPLKEQFKTSLRQLTSPIIPALNMTIAAETGGMGATGNFGKRILGQMGVGALQGGSSNLLNEISEQKFNKILPEVLNGVVGGGTVGAILPSAGAVTRPIAEFGKNFGKNYLTGIARIRPETLNQVIKPNSRALDLNPDQAQSILLDTTQNVRNAYNNLLSRKGEEVQAEIKNLRGSEYRVPLDELKSDIKRTFDQYNGELINPARNMTGGLERNLNELVTGGTSDPRAAEELINRAYNDIVNNNFVTDNIDPLTRNINDVEMGYRELLNRVINNSGDSASYNNAVDEIERLTQKLPQDLQEEYFNRLGKDLNTIYNKTQTIAPIDLEKAKQQIGSMVNWQDETARNFKNPILEQIYGKFNQRLSDLSPELAKANEEFANLRNFQKNEGLNRVLRPGNNIDSASSALKNYNSTVTKGNTGRNIKDLENILVANGSEPFLNTVDDVNAAMDILNIKTTGDSAKANLATTLSIPFLKGIRKYNQIINDVPLNHPFLNKTYENLISPINKVVKNTKGAIVRPLLYRGVPLNGYVQYDEMESDE